MALTCDWPCCRLVVTSEPLDLDLNAARRGAVWWKKMQHMLCQLCPVFLNSNATLRFQLKFMKYGSQLLQRRFYIKKRRNFG